MKKYYTIFILLISVCSVNADTFKNKQTGEEFHGFATQKTSKNQTLVYVEQEDKFKPIVLSEYNVTYDKKGRRETVIVIPIDSEESVLSNYISKTIAESIIKAADSGPQFIILNIDSPGGRGDAMKLITSAITDTTNCPVIAYLNGKKYGGAYSAASVIAMACDKIYISSHATMGSVAPVISRNATQENMDNYTNTFSPQNLRTFRSYAAALAEKNNRPSVIAMGLIDRTMQVIEVENTADGKRSFINRIDRKPTDTIIQTWSRAEIGSMAPGNVNTDTENLDAQMASFILSLKPSDMLKTKMADSIADSIINILEDMGSADAQMINTKNIDKAVSKFKVNKRNLSKVLTNIDFLQKQLDSLNTQLNEVEEQIRKGTVSREVRQNDRNLYDYTARRDSYDRRYGYTRDDYNRYNDRYSRNSRNNNRNSRNQSESYRVDIPNLSPDMVAMELSNVLSTLIRQYRSAINTARRDPGLLPFDVSIIELQKKYDEASALSDDLRRRGIYTMPNVQRPNFVY